MLPNKCKKSRSRISLCAVIFSFLIMVPALPLIAMGASEDKIRVADSNRGIGMVEKKPETNRIPIGKVWALLIGIEEYDHWPKLATPVRDIKALKETLISRYELSEERIRLIANKEASRQGILDGFEWVINEAGENDNVLIYYAGHGELDKVTGYWIPVEAHQDKKGAYISNSNIRDYIGAMKAKHIYLVADSCFSGSLFAGAMRSKPPAITARYFEEVYNRLSRQGITSGGTEPVSDEGYEGHSVFAYYFLKALRENNEPYLTASSLFDRIAVPVSNNSKQTPVSRAIRDVRDEGGEFIFALPKASEGDITQNTQKESDPGSNEKKNLIVGSIHKEAQMRAIVLLSEKNQSVQTKESVVKNILSEKLTERGYRVVSDEVVGKKKIQRLEEALKDGERIASVRSELRSVGDSIVWGSVDTHAGHTGVEGLISCQADASVKVISVDSGEIIVQRNLSNIRGFGADLEKACSGALKNMGDAMGSAIIEKLDNR